MATLGNDGQTCCQAVCPLVFVLGNKGEKKAKIQENKWIGLMSNVSSHEGQPNKVIIALPFVPLNDTSHSPMPDSVTRSVEITTLHLI